MVVVIPATPPDRAIDHLTLSVPEPEVVSVTLHSQNPGFSVHACGVSDVGETCSCREAVGGGGAGAAGVAVGTVLETMTCFALEVAGVTFAMAEEGV